MERPIASMTWSERPTSTHVLLPNVVHGATAWSQYAQGRSGGLPRWVRWGLVGAAAGAITLPLLSGLASDSESNTGRDVVAGAIGGFIIVGGSVALWDAVCAGDTRSRRAGLCGAR